METKPGWLGSVTIALLAIGALALWPSVRGDEVTFCRRVFRGLATGTSAGHRAIDWPRFTALGVDVGATYTGLPNEQERIKYRKTFLQSFAMAFRHAGGRVGAFVQWRKVGQRDGQVVVAADYPAKQRTLLMACSGGWNKKIRSIQWQ